MQMVSEVMTRDVMFVSPQESLQRAAQMMDELNVGVLPVCDGEQLIGMVTDRDMTIRGIAAGKAPQDAHVEDVMSGDVCWCFEDQSLDEVMQQMAARQIRRVPVVTHDEAHRLVGIVALGDLAIRATDSGGKQQVEQVVEKVSSPSEPRQPQQAEGARAAGTSAAGAQEKDFVGAPGAAFAPGAPAGDKDAVGRGPDERNTGTGRRGRVGFAGDPGGLSPADEPGQQSAAPGGGASGTTNAPAGGKGGGGAKP